MIVFHGSEHIVEKPVFRDGKKSNDYGYGFYTTESLDLAKEWACAKNTDGYANRYELNMDGLSDGIADLYMLDIMREGITNGDSRLR